jgi:hypothetical protein
MRHTIGLGVLVAVAFSLRFWLLPSVALDIYVHDVYRVVPIGPICFWFLIGIACVWFLVVLRTSSHFSVNGVNRG